MSINFISFDKVISSVGATYQIRWDDECLENLWWWALQCQMAISFYFYL